MICHDCHGFVHCCEGERPDCSAAGRAHFGAGLDAFEALLEAEKRR